MGDNAVLKKHDRVRARTATGPYPRISGIKTFAPFRRAEDIERVAQAFRIAGMNDR